MISSLLSNRRAVRAASIAVAGAALLSACETDRSIGPVKPAVPDSASLAINPAALPGSLAISVVDWVKNPATYTGASFVISKPGTPDIDLQDNIAPDANIAIGGLLMQNLKPGTYTVCQTAAPDHYVMVFAPCKTVTVLSGKVAQLEFMNYQSARFLWRVMDPWGNPITDMEFKGKDANGQTFDIMDGGALDLDVRKGWIEVEGPTGDYEVCSSALPAGYVFPAGQTFSCTTRYIQPGTIAVMPDVILHHDFSIHWRLRLDGQVYWPASAGTVSFEVKGMTPNGFFSMIVTDNGANDLDAADDLRKGEFAAKLPAAGSYSVCQLNQAIGYQFPAQPCMRVTVSAGVPQLVGWFFNKKI